MRELRFDGVEWHVREVSSGDVPGAQGDRCLIFDSEMKVRRVWDYPASWSELSNEDLSRLASIGRASSSTDTMAEVLGPGSHLAVIAATEAAARSSALLAETAITRASARALRDQRDALLQRCRQTRDDMQTAIRMYAALLNRDGVPPERALLLIKSAMKSGIESTNCGDVEADRLVVDGVSWGIPAYFAA